MKIKVVEYTNSYKDLKVFILKNTVERKENFNVHTTEKLPLFESWNNDHNHKLKFQRMTFISNDFKPFFILTEGKDNRNAELYLNLTILPTVLIISFLITAIISQQTILIVISLILTIIYLIIIVNEINNMKDIIEKKFTIT